MQNIFFEMTEYAKKIESLAANGGTDEIFYNSYDYHALIVLKNLVKNATDYIKSICGNMCSDVSNDPEYIELVKKFLEGDSKRKFKILFDDKYKDDFLQRPIAKIFSKYPKQVEIRRLNNDGYIQYEGKQIHLTVSDDRAFRCETDVENKMAWGNFKSPKQAQGFSAAFDKFYTDSYSSIIDLPTLKPIANC